MTDPFLCKMIYSPDSDESKWDASALVNGPSAGAWLGAEVVSDCLDVGGDVEKMVCVMIGTEYSFSSFNMLFLMYAAESLRLLVNVVLILRAPWPTPCAEMMKGVCRAEGEEGDRPAFCVL